MAKKLTTKAYNLKKRSALRKQRLKIAPQVFGFKTTLEMINKPVLDKMAAAVASASN